VEALKTVEPKINPAHELILDLLYTNYHGLTADEVAFSLNYKVLFARPRMSELHKAGKIYRGDKRRKNASGLSATVWRIAA